VTHQQRLIDGYFMDIHFVSTLTPEDEDMYAPTVLNAVRAILDAMPIAYTLRIETASTRVYQHTKSDVEVVRGPAEDLEEETPPFVPGRVTFS
jgi:hypothetical protein